MKKVLKKIIIVSLIVTLVLVATNTIFAEITHTELNTALIDGENGQKTTILNQILKKATSLGFISGAIIDMLSLLIRFIIYMVVSVISVVFSMMGVTENTEVYFPMPYHMVFNIIPFFDPNFINPAKAPPGGSFNLIEIVSKAISPLYYTGVSIVATLFVVIALIIGIKLAISVSAQQKAQYKTAIATWLTGIILLFVGHFLMAGIFFLNEQIVSNLYQAAQKEEIPVSITLLKDKELSFMEKLGAWVAGAAVGAATTVLLGPVLGVSFGAILVNEGLNQVETVQEKAYGFEGMFLMYLQRSVSGELMATIILAVMIGQTIALTILYIKRLFYCLILGMLFPFVIGIDTIKKVLGQKGGLFEKWLTQFGIAVFMQSIHAFIMFFTMILINSLAKQAGITTLDTQMGDNAAQHDKVAGLIAIIEVVAIASLTRVEAIIKDFVGVPDSKAGSLQNAGKLGFAGFSLAAGATKNIKDNFTGMAAGRKGIKSTRSQLEKAKAREVQPNAAPPKLPTDVANKDLLTYVGPSATRQTSTVQPGIGDGKVDMNDVNQALKATGTASPEVNRIALALDKILQAVQSQTSTMSSTIKGAASPDRLTKGTGIQAAANAELPKQAQTSSGLPGKSVQELEMQLREQEKQLAGKTIAAIMSPATVVAGLAMGGGASGSLNDMSAISGALISGGDKIAETIGKNVGREAQLKMIEPQINYEEHLQQKISEQVSYESSANKTIGGNQNREKSVKTTIDNKRKKDNIEDSQ